MRGKIARIAAAVLALLLVLGYFFMPIKEDRMTMSNSGRKKQEVPIGETLEWPWTPSMENVESLEVKLTGMKKAQGITLTVQVRDEAGNVIGENKKAIADLGEDGDGVGLAVRPEAGKQYVLAISSEGEGQEIKLKGAEDDAGAFYPLLKETGSVTKYNPVLLYFAAGWLLLALTPVFAADRKRLPKAKKRIGVDTFLPWGTFFMILAVGLLVCLHKPAYYPGAEWGTWDEQIHIDAVRSMQLFADGGLRYILADMITWHPGYIPLAIGYSIAAPFTNTEATMYYAGVIASTVFYAAMCALAVKHAPRYKATFMVAGTLPTVLFQMTSFTYDTVVTGSIILGIALVLECIDREEGVSTLRAITMTALLAFGTVAKPAYSVALFALWMIPAERFGGKKKAWFFRIFVLIMLVWCMASMAMPGAYDGVIEGDERFAGTSRQGQIEYMLANPIEGGLKPIVAVWERQAFLMQAGISHWAYQGNNSGFNDLFLVLLLLVAPLCTCGEDLRKRSLLTPGRRITLGLIAVGAEILLAYAQYLVSSEVGGNLSGLQARYFMAVWAPMALAFMWPHGIRKISKHTGDIMTVVVFVTCAWANIQNAVEHLVKAGFLG